MTTNRYGSETTNVEFRDLQATTMSLDKSGEFALLAGKRYLGILSLNSLLEGPSVLTPPTGAPPSDADKLLVRYPYKSKYEISCTQWSKLDDGGPKQIAVACSQRCDVFDLTDSELKSVAKMKGHTRVIADLDWCCVHGSLLATTSMDSYVHIWDVRVNRSGGAVSDKPQITLAALDGASQVKWSLGSENILASCDGGHVKIWDSRKPSSPAEFIAAHASKINGLEWVTEDMLITAAQDCTVKFIKFGGENQTKVKGPILNLSAPVWRARPAPFGRGVVTQCVHIIRRDSGGMGLALWDWQRSASPTFTFQAYDTIEFAWRKTDNCDLVTWSRDQKLRIWKLPREILQLCGGEEKSSRENNRMTSSVEDQEGLGDDVNDGRGVEVTEGEEDDEDDEEQQSPLSLPRLANSPIPSTARNSTITTTNPFAGTVSVTVRHKRSSSTLERRSRKSSSPSPMSRRDELLKAELEKVENDKPENINFDQIELEKGLLRFSWVVKSTEASNGKSKGVTAGILASFPNGYPAAPPTFLVTNSSNEVDKNHIVKSLRNTAQQFAKKNETSLAACIKQFGVLMRSIKSLDDINSSFSSRAVSNVPFPRTSGARFCAVGMLVCFGRPSYLRRVKSNCDAGTPRSLSDLGSFLSQVASENEDSGTLRQRRSRRVEKKTAGLVTVFDVSPLLPFSRNLAANYVHMVSNPSLRTEAFQANVAAAVNQKKPLAANVWQACSIVSKYAQPVNRSSKTNEHHINNMDEEDSTEWLAHHPLGTDLIHSMISHFAKYGDVQTAATVGCLFNPTGQSSTFSDNDECMSTKEHDQLKGQFKLPGMGSPYHTVHGSDTHHHHGVMVAPISDSFFRQHRSNSWSDSIDDIKHGHSPVPPQDMPPNQNPIINGATGVGNNGMFSSTALPANANSSTTGHATNNNSFVLMPQQGGNNRNGHLSSASGGGASSNTNGNKVSLGPVSSSNGYGSTKTNTPSSSNALVTSTKHSLPNGIILDPLINQQFYDRYKKSYAEILHRWGLVLQRAEVLKNMTGVADYTLTSRVEVNFSVRCTNCRISVKGSKCTNCKKIISFCSICHLPARGLSTICIFCGHGGHAGHINQWFAKKQVCPAGCGCRCVLETSGAFR